MLNQHDILLKLDDQILIETRQPSVFIRNKEGDEVTLTYLRAGERATAKIKLGTHDAPKVSALSDPAAGRPNPSSRSDPGRATGGELSGRNDAIKTSVHSLRIVAVEHSSEAADD